MTVLTQAEATDAHRRMLAEPQIQYAEEAQAESAPDLRTARNIVLYGSGAWIAALAITIAVGGDALKMIAGLASLSVLIAAAASVYGDLDGDRHRIIEAWRAGK